MPNMIAGILIGTASTSWFNVLVSASVWPFVFCVYVALVNRMRTAATIVQLKDQPRLLLFNSPVATFFAIEFATALSTATPVALIVFLIKQTIA